MEKLVGKLDEICDKIGRKEFPVTSRNVTLDEEQEKEFRELQANARKQYEERVKQEEERKKKEEEEEEKK